MDGLRMMKIAICDDESYFRRQIREILAEYFDRDGIVYQIDDFESGKSFADLGIGIAQYNVVFLDINMEELSGLETARKMREVSKDIFLVFVTAFINYTIEGYKYDAVRYILKNNASLRESVFECMDAIEHKMNCVARRKSFEFCEGTMNVLLERILYIESRLHKMEFNIMEEQLNKYSMYGTLDDIEDELDDKTFVRIHKSYLVNMRHIKEIVRYEAVLNNGIKLPIPRNRYKDVEEAYITYRGEI